MIIYLYYRKFSLITCTAHFGGMLVLLILRVCPSLPCLLIITAISTNFMLNFVCLRVLNQYLVISHWFSSYIPNILFVHTVLTQMQIFAHCVQLKDLAMTRSVTSNIIHRLFSLLLTGQSQQKQLRSGSGAAVSSLFSIFLPLLLASFFLLLHASRRYATLITFFQQSLIILLTLRIRWATYAVEGMATAIARILVI